MKKKTLYLFLVLVLLFSGCTAENTIESPVIPPAAEVLPLPDIDASEEEGDNNNDGNDNKKEEDKKNDGTEETTAYKKYAVSKVNSLRVRSTAGQNGSTLGYLDKKDAVLIKGKSGNYYITTYKEKTAYVYADYCEEIEIKVANNNVEKAIDVASTLLGYPYVWGAQRYHWGNGKLNGDFKKGEFDCSSLTLYAFYASNRIVLDITSRKQSLNGVMVEKKDLSRGDLMFFTNQSRINKTGIEKIGHVGIYLGDNYILHTASDYAVIEPVSSLRWSYYITARRVA